MIQSATWTIRLRSAANLREHHHAKARRVKRERDAALMLARCTLSRPELPCAIELVRVAPRSLDSDNLASAFKATRDGIADWLEVDDGDRRVTWIYKQEKGRAREYAVRVTIADTRFEIEDAARVQEFEEALG